MKRLYLLLFLFVLPKICFGQLTVSTLYSNSSSIIKDIAIDKYGNIYTGFINESTGQSFILKIDKNTKDTSIYANLSYYNPRTLVFDTSGCLYVTLMGYNKILKVPQGGGNPQIYVTDIKGTKYGASGIVMDADTLYFIDAINHYIYKVLPGGGSVNDTDKVIPIQKIQNALGSYEASGLDFLPNGNLISFTQENSTLKFYEINKVTGAVSFLFSIPSLNISDMNRLNDSTYVIPGGNTGFIYSLTITNTYRIDTIAGCGEWGYLDGDAKYAKLGFVAYVGIDKNDGKIYFSSTYDKYYIRKIQECELVDISVSADYNCMLSNVYLSASISDTSKINSFNWTGPNGFTLNDLDTSFILTRDRIGRYTFNGVDKKGCYFTKTINIIDKSSYSRINVKAKNEYTSPSGKYIWTTSGDYSDTLINKYGCDSIISIKLTILNIDSNSIYSVSTLYNSSCYIEGIAFDADGNVYFAERSSCNVIKKIDSQGNISTYATVTGDPISLAFDNAGNLYASCFEENKIIKIPAGGGSYTDYVTGIQDVFGPADIFFIKDTLYFLEYSYQRLYKVLPGGGNIGSQKIIPIQNTYYGIAGSGARTMGLDTLPDGNFIVTTYFNGGKIYKVDRKTGVSTLLTTLPSDDYGSVTHTSDGYYYFPAFNANKIYKVKIDSLWNVTTFAGSGVPGSADGDLLEAQFWSPISIKTNDMYEFYVGDFNTKKLRKISLCNKLDFSISKDFSCLGSTTYLSASIGDTSKIASYKWIGPENFNSSQKDTSFILTYDRIGTYNFILTDKLGCTHSKSVYIPNLQTNSEMNASSCEGYYISPSGKKWNQSGVYFDTLTNVYGCDSVIYFNLTINSIDTAVNIVDTMLFANQPDAEYYWLDCNNNYEVIKGEYGRYFAPTETGSYAVMLYYNGCYDTSRCINFTVTPHGNGINNNQIEQWTIYPTINDGKFTLKSNSESEFVLQDLAGRIIRTYRLKGNSMIVNETLPSGIYFIIEKNSGKGKKMIIK